jgi:hypothetical protein
LEAEVKELLAPLTEKCDQLRATENELEARKQGVRAERIRVEKILRAGGLIETAKRTKKGSTRSVSAPDNGLPRTQRGMENLEALENAVKGFDGDPFQIKMLEEATGISRSGCESGIGYMRGQDKIRLLGNRTQIGRTAPGGRTAATYQEIR